MEENPYTVMDKAFLKDGLAQLCFVKLGNNSKT
jgi:hypothetical protein